MAKQKRNASDSVGTRPIKTTHDGVVGEFNEERSGGYNGAQKRLESGNTRTLTERDDHISNPR